METYSSPAINLNKSAAEIYAQLQQPSALTPLLEKAGDTPILKTIQLSDDALSIELPMAGRVTFTRIEATPHTMVRYQASGAPFALNLLARLRDVGEKKCEVIIDIEADLPFFVQGMVGGKIKEALAKAAKHLEALGIGQ